MSRQPGKPATVGGSTGDREAIGHAFTEAELSVPRQKPFSIGTSAAYRALKLARRLVSRERLLQLSLEAAWLSRRLAFELSAEVFGPKFHDAALGWREGLMLQWIPPEAEVLDVGCGNGRWARTMARAGRKVLGMDADPAAIQRARELAVSERLTDVEFECGDVTRDLKGRRFDVALLVHLLEHIEDADSFLRSMGEIAASLIIEVPDFESDSLNLPRHALGCRFYLDNDHVREYTSEILRSQLERNGWRVRHQERRAGSLLAVAVRR